MPGYRAAQSLAVRTPILVPQVNSANWERQGKWYMKKHHKCIKRGLARSYWAFGGACQLFGSSHFIDQETVTSTSYPARQARRRRVACGPDAICEQVPSDLSR